MAQRKKGTSPTRNMTYMISSRVINSSSSVASSTARNGYAVQQQGRITCGEGTIKNKPAQDRSASALAVRHQHVVSFCRRVL